MLEQGKDDFAFRYLQETSKRVDEEVAVNFSETKQTITDARYEALAGYLKNRQWKEAAKETYHLMITTLNKEPGQWFEPDELLNFPCDNF